MRVLAFESRKSEELASLVERQGGVCTIAPALRELTLGLTPELREFLEQLRAGRFDVLLFLTGVGTTYLAEAIAEEMPLEEFVELLQRSRVVVRGPKPFAVLRKWNARVDAKAEEPNTSQEVLTAIESLRLNPRGTAGPLAGLRFAIQEYGGPAIDLCETLQSRGAEVLSVPVYRWALPDDVEPLKRAIRDTIAGQFDVLLITTAQHPVHVLQVAEEMGLRDEWIAATSRLVVGSIGPTATERLKELGLPVDVEPAHPKMGPLVRDTLEQAPGILTIKRAASHS